MRVQDKSDTLPGLLDKEVGDIISVLGVGVTLVFKDTRKQKNQMDVVITTGSHFVMVLKEKGSSITRLRVRRRNRKYSKMWETENW